MATLKTHHAKALTLFTNLCLNNEMESALDLLIDDIKSLIPKTK